ncbi:phosphotransferase family protein [Rhodococcus sp. USK13]|uniref:phosphotransferase family protein n=1 Tax=Rhodococcus sp. USK13 TaxID=2806442 RepID=UPI001BD0F510|nr:phosphotransferase family protein [Rhodococcus sp. USK13]
MSSTTLPGLDLTDLSRHLRTVASWPDGDIRARLIAGGRSNLTYLLEVDDRRFVLRRPPLGHILSTAHDMAREHRVLTSLRDTDVPIPDTIHLCTDELVIGAPFYVMDYVPGRVFQTARDLADLGSESTRALVLELVRMLARLHAVPIEGPGLRELGRPEGFLRRQVDRWQRQLEASATRDLAGAADLTLALRDRVPEPDAATLLHGDYRLDNVLVEDGRITAVLDWEMATLGDPLTDLALLVSRNHDVCGEDGMMFDTSLAPGFPASTEMIEEYARASCRDVSRLPWFIALAHFKRAAILEGLHHRHVQGLTVGDGFEHAGDLVLPAIRAGLESIENA